ncbi:MAG: hypothetical protein B9S37_01015 [Verrucomicrobiia bacterium Tous-C3TDCM]|nr:MAG: hypothetical protein B9S37_01015 [Verrucomicrobiae bacterium Tous-C3TDCM]PAZ07033.1 MAG: hypothetical protein CAK88_01915 [Verrucomicrobiae bacterium AMD-G2]
MTPKEKYNNFLNYISNFQNPKIVRENQIRAFRKDGVILFPESRSAYIKIHHTFKLLIAADIGYFGNDPIAAVQKSTSSIRWALWHYCFDCLPDYGQKENHLRDKGNDALTVFRNLEIYITEILQSNIISDSAYAKKLDNEENIKKYAKSWIFR